MEDYTDSCSWFINIVAKPQPRCTSYWADEFAHWSGFQVTLYLLIGLVWVGVGVSQDEEIGPMVSHFAVGLLIAFFLGHLGFFIIVCEDGCCHPVVCFFFGVFYLFLGFEWATFAWNGKAHFDTHLHYTPFTDPARLGEKGEIARKVLYGIYAFSLIYMGVSACMVFFNGRGGYHGNDRERGIELEEASEWMAGKAPKGSVRRGSSRSNGGPLGEEEPPGDEDDRPLTGPRSDSDEEQHYP